MKPVDMIKFGYLEGDCFAACLASIFEIEIEAVPGFPVEPKAAEWITILNNWLKENYDLVYVTVDSGDAYAYLIRAPESPWCIASGKSPRGLAHVVVAQGFEIIHDPHPSRDGIESIEDFGFFIPIDPLKVVK